MNMRKIFKVILLLIFVILLLLAFYFYMGWFKKLVAFEVVMWPYNMLYKQHTWAYYKISNVMDDLYNYALNQDITSDMWIAIYYDNPKEVQKDKLRSDWGILIDDLDIVLDTWYNLKQLDKNSYVVVTFPLKNNFSYMLWAYKAYPLILEYMLEEGYQIMVPMIEMYDMKNNLIYYMAEAS